MAEDKSTPFAVRMEQEDKERLMQLIQESGKSNKDFMTSLISLYEVSKAKIKNINLVDDIEQLEQQTTKINQIFINIIDKLEGQKAAISDENEKELQIYKEKVYNLTIEFENLNTDFQSYSNMYTEIKEVNSNLKKNIEQLESTIKDKTFLVDEYKEKNDTLSGLLNEYSTFKGQLDEYKRLLTESQSKVYNLENVNKEQERDKASLLKDIESLKTKHVEELKRAEEKALFEKEKALLEQEKTHQEIINRLNEQHNNKVRELLESLEGKKSN